MSIKLLPASVTPGEPSQAPDVALDVSTCLAPLTQRAVTTQGGLGSLVPSADTFASSSSTTSSAHWGEAPFIDAMPVEDSPSPKMSDETSDQTGFGWEYVSGWAWSGLVAGTAIAQYLLYAASPISWSARLINVYA